MNLPGTSAFVLSADTIPTSELSSLAASTTAAWEDTCAIVVQEATDDGQGTSAQVWATVALDVPCNLEKPTRDTAKVAGAVLQSTVQFILHVPLGTDLQPPYSAIKSGQMYNVIDTDSGRSNAVDLAAIVVRLWNWPVS